MAMTDVAHDAVDYVRPAEVAEEALYHPKTWLGKYVFSQDAKIIALQYSMTAMAVGLIALLLSVLMRLQLGFPGVFSFITPDAYIQFVTMHGMIMVIYLLTALFLGGFGNYLIPLMVGARDMVFPYVNMLSYWIYLGAVLLLITSFFVPGGATGAGWTLYPPQAILSGTPGSEGGIILMLVSLALFIIGFTMGGLNYVVTVLQARTRGMTLMRLPLTIWGIFTATVLALLAFPALFVGAVMMTFDKLLGTSFFMPAIVEMGEYLDYGGGSPLLFQHLFWFFGHPEVYIVALPAFGIVSDLISVHSRRHIFGYRMMVWAIVGIGALSFFVWAHHMYMTGMGTVISAFFQTTTLIISIPSIIILTCLFISLWGGSIRFNTPMLFALAFLPMFGIGGLTGLPLGFNFSDVALHDSYYVIAHFHYVVAPGTSNRRRQRWRRWFPKMTGRRMNEFWGRVHFWGSLIFMNLIFMPMFAQGMAGMSRRMSDGGATYSLANPDNADITVGALGDTIMGLNVSISAAAWAMLVAQLPFIVNLFWSVKHGEKVKSDNPWQATTLEWETPTPPPHGNFIKEVKAYRDPYEYSVPGAKEDFTPQAQPAK